MGRVSGGGWNGQRAERGHARSPGAGRWAASTLEGHRFKGGNRITQDFADPQRRSVGRIKLKRLGKGAEETVVSRIGYVDR